MENEQESLGSRDFWKRHIGVTLADKQAMLAAVGYFEEEDFFSDVFPSGLIRSKQKAFASFETEAQAFVALRQRASKNIINKSWIGAGYASCHTPAVLQRHVLENPAWYTPYTPYQPEISQGRLEALLNFQTVISGLTGLPIANASLLDEATACAEAMTLAHAVKNKDGSRAFFIADDCHPQTIEVLKTKAKFLGVSLLIGQVEDFAFDKNFFAALLAYPSTYGDFHDYENFSQKVHDSEGMMILSCDPLALVLLKSPGDIGADIAVGSAQRFGCPLGFGGPHAAFFATKDEYKRLVPGRVVGVSKDASGRRVFRLSLQTREQHIRREKATSNICTSQALLANLSGFYALYHGEKGLNKIACQVHNFQRKFASFLLDQGYHLKSHEFFDTLSITEGPVSQEKIRQRALKHGVNLAYFPSGLTRVAFDETTSVQDVLTLFSVFCSDKKTYQDLPVFSNSKLGLPQSLKRSTSIFTHKLFLDQPSETEFMRYLRRLELKDISLLNSMIPLGSCTMKLNASCEMIPTLWPEFANVHPYVPEDQVVGYSQLICELDEMLCQLTGFAAFSFQPNSGAQGEYTGLLVIKKYLESIGEGQRNVCLIPSSAHGTNPASARIAGFVVKVIKCDQAGNIDLKHLTELCEENKNTLAAMMVTYPSTHGVFEENIEVFCALIHRFGGQVYLDGANFNAQAGELCPTDYGADVCHLNLHKTFCIPHGGGGPGAGPIGVKKHLLPFLPKTHYNATNLDSIGMVSSAPYGSASLYPISWVYLKLLGGAGVQLATRQSIISANYIAHRLRESFPILYMNDKGLVAHECILDLRSFKATCSVDVQDVAKRLMDFGFHAPTISWPVVNTMMIEPTESESKEEIDRFCDAMLEIRKEIGEVEQGDYSRENNVLKNSPHTQDQATSTSWSFPYTREKAVFPGSDMSPQKYWPPVGRVDDAYGDRNFCCTF